MLVRGAELCLDGRKAKQRVGHQARQQSGYRQEMRASDFQELSSFVLQGARLPRPGLAAQCAHFTISHSHTWCQGCFLEITHKSPIRLRTGRKEVKWTFESSEEDRPGTQHTLDAI